MSKTFFICINCATPEESLYITYSTDVIRITECKNCGKAVDKYIEYDIVLVFIDLILQYGAAYRHLLINTPFKPYLRLAILFLLCNAYEKWIERRAATLSESARIYDLEWTFYESLLQSCIEMSSYILVVTLGTIIAGSKIMPKIDYMLGSLTGFYGNIFVVFSIIWKLHQHWSYRTLTSLFIFISHIQVQRSLCFDLSMLTNITIVMLGVLIEKLMGGAITKLIEQA